MGAEKNTGNREMKRYLTIKNVIEEWNELSLVKKIGYKANGMVLVVCLWMVIVDEWIGIDDKIDAMW